MGYSGAVRRLLGVLAILSFVCTASVTEPAATWNSRVHVGEGCAFRLRQNRSIVLTSTVTVRNAPGGRSASVRFVPGWSIGPAYPKAGPPFVVRLAPGQTVRRTTSRRVVGAPRLWKLLRTGSGLNCASSYSVSFSAPLTTAP